MELVKKQIHMNQWKGSAATQITLDDDFIVPDTMDDIRQVMMDTGEVAIESVKNLGDKVSVKGRLEFQILYRKESGGLQTLGGNIPFEETVNADFLEEKDAIGASWMLEDLNTEMINSRKLGVQAIITLQIRAETVRSVCAAVDVDMEAGQTAPKSPGVETMKRTITAAALVLRRKDTYRLKEEIGLNGGKPNIGQLLWQEMKLRGTDVRPMEGKLRMEGDLDIFAIYQPEDENMPVQWLEETIPFSGELELSEASEDMIPMIGLRLAHKELEPKPDADGEMRQLEADAVVELDIKLYQEQEAELLGDIYSNSAQIELTTEPVTFDTLLAKNICRCRISEKVRLDQEGRILQICHSQGTIKIDEVETGEDRVEIEGVLEVRLLYLTADDSSPIQTGLEQIPFRCQAEVPGADKDSLYQLEPGLEQLGCVMLGGDMVEIKASLALELLVLQPVNRSVITGISVKPMDFAQLQKLPGIAGYIVQQGDTLWDIAKKFHTTVGNIMAANELPDDQAKAGMRLLLVKEIEQP